MAATDFSIVQAAHQPDPYPRYAALVADRPFGLDRDPGLWVAASAAAVSTVLDDPRCRVRPPGEPVPTGLVGTAAGDVFGRLVRMTDGDEQRRLKAIVVEALSGLDPEQVRAIAADRVKAVLAEATTAELPYERLMFAVPVQVVGRLCGLPGGTQLEEATGWVADFVQCIPATASADQQAGAARAAARLAEALEPNLTPVSPGLIGALVRSAAAIGSTDSGLLQNGIGLLSQTFDATAGLIGNTLLALARPGRSRPDPGTDLRALVREVARHDAPIQNTRRFAASDLTVLGHEVRSGEPILVLLAAANRDPAANSEPDLFRPDRPNPTTFTFSAARHLCPGEVLAVTIATTVIEEVLASGWNPADLLGVQGYLPSPNARIPILTEQSPA